jgi:DNA-binding CsgD family transcriptional regulator
MKNMSGRFNNILSFCVCLFLIANSYGFQKTDEQLNVSSLKLDSIYLLEDELNHLNILEINKNNICSKFQLVDPLSMDKIALGMSSSTWWFRLHLTKKAKLETTHYLTIGFSLLEDVEVYIPDGKGDFTIHRSGITAEKQPIGWSTRVPTFQLKDLSDEPVIYLKIKSKSPILIPLQVQTEKQYFSLELMKNLFFGVFFGIIFLVICYNLILFILTKESIYFYYLIYMFFLSILILNYYGFSYQYLWYENSNWIDKVMPVSIIITGLSMINFIRHFLNTKSIFPAFDTFFLFYMIAYIMLIPIAFFISTSTLFIMLAPTSGILIVMLLVILVKSRQKNFLPATYMLIGWFFLFVGITSLVAKTFGLIPHNSFTSFAILIGVVIESIMFTIGIGNRFRWFQKESMRMTEELKVKHSEIESLREKIANNIIGGLPKTSQLPITISKADINNYLFNELTERELEVLYKVAEGLTNKEIGHQLFISTHTVRAHMRKIYEKLHVKNRTEAVFKAKQLQLIS